MKKSDISMLRISSSLIQLLKIYPIDKITITMLCDYAKVSRSSFYNNYKNIEDVLKKHYINVHYQTFQNKYRDNDYMYSNQHIIDFINFFDINSDLMIALMKWNLLPYIAKYNTEIVLHDLSDCNDLFIKQHNYYFMIYHCSQYFYLCVAWLANGKKESPDELFSIIKNLKQRTLNIANTKHI